MARVYPNGQVEVTITSGDSVKIFTKGTAKVYYKQGPGNVPSFFYLQTTVTNTETSLTPSGVDTIRIDADVEEVLYEVGTAPEITEKTTSQQAISATVGDAITTATLVRNTIADTGTVTVAQHRDQVLYQDASGGAVTMTSATGTLIAAEFADMAIGDALLQYMASNHATNTSTIAGGTDVTLVGNGAVTNTGGSFLLIKTAATTFDLVRVG